MKQCSMCKVVKHLSDFSYTKTTGKYHPYCKLCMREYSRRRTVAFYSDTTALEKAIAVATTQFCTLVRGNFGFKTGNEYYDVQYLLPGRALSAQEGRRLKKVFCVIIDGMTDPEDDGSFAGLPFDKQGWAGSAESQPKEIP